MTENEYWAAIDDDHNIQYSVVIDEDHGVTSEDAREEVNDFINQVLQNSSALPKSMRTPPLHLRKLREVAA